MSVVITLRTALTVQVFKRTLLERPCLKLLILSRQEMLIQAEYRRNPSSHAQPRKSKQVQQKRSHSTKM